MRLRHVSLRAKLVAWFVVLHALLATGAVFVAMQRPLLLFALEVAFVISIVISVRLVRSLFVPLDLIRTGAQLMSERDFTMRFSEVGQPEMDELIAIYNRMADRLRDERLVAEEQHQLLRKMVQASPSGIVLCDFEGEVEQVNPAAEPLLREPAIREALTSIAPGESRLVSIASSRRLKIWRGEFHDRGFVKSFFLLEEMTDDLRLSEKSAYEKVIRMMSHEVNNSVAAVRSLLESVLRYAPQIGSDDRDDFTAALTIASTRADHLNRFMSAFADVVRIPPPILQPIDLAPLLRDVETLLRSELEQRAIVLRLDVEVATSTVNIDRSQFEQVLINIVRNAAESIDGHGTIDVIWRDHVLRVLDTGAGIADADRAELFTPFFTTKPNGRGLGLTIVQEILANQRLPFALENREGRGAEFRIAFP